ncbi:archaemetzincin [Planctomycetota bacterium]
MIPLALLALGFTPPNSAEREKAIGPTGHLSKVLQGAFRPDPEFFSPIPAPKPGDWLIAHPESGQTYADFAGSRPNRPDRKRHTVYLQPLGAFPKDRSPSLELLEKFTGAFLAMEVKVLPTIPIDKGAVTTRVNAYTKNRQVLAGDVLRMLKKKVPADAFCVQSVTMDDLYPEPTWNFVFGMASLRERVGVFSFVRYDPAFYGKTRGSDYEKVLLLRSCKVLVHESGHMFGIEHCVYFSCLMNGSNHLKESDSRDIHLCPVCLRKLYHGVGFDVVKRYRALAGVYKEMKFDSQAAWVERRLKKISVK